MFHSKYASSPCWSLRTWLNKLQKGGPEKRFQYYLEPHSADIILYLRAIQGHSGGKHIDPTLQDNVLLPSDFAEHICHVGSSRDLRSIIQSGLQGRQERETCGVLHGREPNVQRSLQRKGLRRDEAQNCSVQKQLAHTQEIQYIGVN